MSYSHANPLKILHYNIKELSSSKIKNGHDQLRAVKEVLKPYQFDILSLNEIQYDLPNVPSKEFTSTGQNLLKLQKQLLGPEQYSYVFAPANTGQNAKRNNNGVYFENPNTPIARDHADQVNFGTMPAQYSTGALINRKVLKYNIINKLKWLDFNPKIDFSSYKLANGENIPNEIELFDKNFTDFTIEHDGKVVHILLLHTVPSYHFGNKFSINDKRNADQLRFLEWYTTGKTDFPVNIQGVSPLPKNSYYIIMGDLNVSVFDEESEGKLVLENIFSKTNPWMKLSEKDYTNEASHFGPKPHRLLLDYIIASTNIKSINGKIIRPTDSRINLGCLPKKDSDKNKKNDMIEATYIENGKECSALISRNDYNLKIASDHFPLYGEFILQ
jgi:hypothetical protein